MFTHTSHRLHLTRHDVIMPLITPTNIFDGYIVLNFIFYYFTLKRDSVMSLIALIYFFLMYIKIRRRIKTEK